MVCLRVPDSGCRAVLNKRTLRGRNGEDISCGSFKGQGRKVKIDLSCKVKTCSFGKKIGFTNSEPIRSNRYVKTTCKCIRSDDFNAEPDA